MAVAFFCNLIFMVYAWAFDCTVLFLIPAPDAAGTVWSPELFFVPYQPPDHGTELLLIRIEYPALLVCIPFCPFVHFFFFFIFFCHDTRLHP